MANGNARKKPARDDRVIDLLNKLGERLISSEDERKALKDAVDSLEDKAELNEKAYISLQNKLSDQEVRDENIAARQEWLERKLDAQFEKIEKAAALTDKIEEVLKQQSRLNRRLDSVSQERGRMLRKLEKIEDNIIETQEALNAKAMVLLTDEQTANDSGKPVLAAKGKETKKNQHAPPETTGPWWQRNARLQAGAMAAAVVLAVLAGWAISQWQGKAQFNAVQKTAGLADDLTESNNAGTIDKPMPVARVTAPADDADNFSAESSAPSVFSQGLSADRTDENVIDAFTAGVEKEMEDAETPDNAEEQATGGTLPDDEELIARFEENPDALGAELNKIEPVARKEESVSNAGEDVSQNNTAFPAPEETKTEPAVLLEKQVPAFDIEEFIAAQSAGAPVEERISKDPDLPAVLKEVEQKAFAGVAEAQHDLAAIYIAGHGGIPVNHERGAQWFREAAIQGIANARYNLGVLYHQGLGVPQDTKLALNWYKAAAAKDHPEAQYNLGIAHIEGIGVPYDPARATAYFQNAAASGIMEAAYNLGLIEENGLLGQPEPEKALYWYQAAVDMGSPEAQTALDQLAARMNYSPADIARITGALNLMEKTAKDRESPEQRSNNTEERSGGAQTETVPVMPLTAGDQALPEQGARGDSGGKDRETLAQIQKQLIELGLFPGPANGQNDQRTEDAIRAYQSMYALREDGEPSEALLVHMITTGLDSGTSGEVGSRAE